MAFQAQLSSLTDELIASITGLSGSDGERFNLYRETALRNLRHHNFGRTNQFIVDERLVGYEERFHVHGREGLAHALSSRLALLSALPSKWNPEFLHLLLELADQPVQKSDLADLELLKQPEEEPEPPLRWEDIFKEDGSDADGDLWRDVNFADSDEDVDNYADVESEASAGTDSTSLVGTDQLKRAANIVASNLEADALLETVKSSQAWRLADLPKDALGRSKKIPISDAQFLREVLFMLQGLPTTLFDESCAPVPDFQLSSISWDSHRALITSFAEQGRMLVPLRSFASSKQGAPLMQIFQDSIQQSLQAFDSHVSTIQARYVAIQKDVVVSLMGVLTELKSELLALNVLSDVVRQVQTKKTSHAFRYLELLFDATVSAQLEGDTARYRGLGTIFFDCFKVYLRPIRLWMEEGTLVSGDKIFFVSQSTAKVPLSQVWQNQYLLRQTQDGTLHAPRFLHPSTKKIFTTGKSVVMLKYLGLYSSRDQKAWEEPKLDFDAVCGGDLDFSPFSEVFNASFEAWIQSKHHTASGRLREILFKSCGLSASLDALKHIYLMADGSVSDQFAAALFGHLDTLSGSWRDTVALTGIAQEAYFAHCDSDRLTARIDDQKVVNSGLASRNSVKTTLPAILPVYRLNWPVQLVIQDTAMAGYQSIFTFLLQLKRAAHVLKKVRLRNSVLQEAELGIHDLYCLIKAKLLWFITTVLTYLTTLVLAPGVAELSRGLEVASDVDEMIRVHSLFIKRTTDECCLGAKLNPIRECILDILDLAIKLEDMHSSELLKEKEELQEISRLSIMSSPAKLPAKAKPERRGAYADLEQEEEEDELVLQSILRESASEKPYFIVLQELHKGFEKHLRFVVGGLRGVARASRDAAAGRWDILAEMLEMGIRDKK